MANDLTVAIERLIASSQRPWTVADFADHPANATEIDSDIATILNAVVSGGLVRADLCASGQQVRALDAERYLNSEAAYYGGNDGQLDGIPFAHVAHVCRVMRDRLAALTPAPQPKKADVTWTDLAEAYCERMRDEEQDEAEAAPTDNTALAKSMRGLARHLRRDLAVLHHTDPSYPALKEMAADADRAADALTPAPDAPQVDVEHCGCGDKACLACFPSATPTAQEAVPVAWRARRSESEEWQHFTSRPSWLEVQPLYAHPPQPSETVEEAQIDAIAVALSKRIYKQTEGEWQPSIRQADELARAALRALKGGEA